MKYFRRTECGSPEEIAWVDFVKGVRGEFVCGENYYEHMFVLFGMGHELIGSSHMYWIERND